MIGFLDKNYTRQIVALWQEAFGDSKEFILDFLNEVGCGRAFGFVEGKKLKAMFFLIDSELHHGSETHRAWYLYAAATAKECRRQGIMAALIDKAEALAKLSGVEYIALVPANEKLFLYYEKFGFKKFFYRRICKEEYDFSPTACPRLTLGKTQKFALKATNIQYTLHSFPIDFPAEGKTECNGMIYSLSGGEILSEKGFFSLNMG